MVPAERVAVLLVDGLGWHLLDRSRAVAPTLAALLRGGRRLTAGFPTTTATSLACLGTGLPAGVHGMLGYEVFVDGGRPVNLLRWDDALDPERFQPRRTVLERAEAAGVAVTSIGPRAFRGTGLTRAALRGGRRVGADTFGELVSGVSAALSEPEPALVYAYTGDLDATGHRHGWRSPAWRAQLAMTDRLVELLVDALPAGAALHVVADHGMVDVPRQARVDLAREPDLAAGVEAVAGEPRAVYLRTAPGARDDVVATWRERLGREWWVLTTDEANASGWFGGLDRTVADRVGDVVAAARVPGVACVDSRTMPPGLLALVGLHGSLTDDERHVPLLTVMGGA